MMTNELDELARAAWAAPAKAVELWRKARKHPDLTRTASAYEWVRKKGYERDHRLDQNQLEWVAIGLARQGDPRVLPFIVARARERWDFGRLLLPWLETDRLDRGRLAAAVRSWLEEPGDVHAWKLAARCLARVGDPEDAAAVAARLGECFDAMWSPDASQTVRMEGHAASLGASLLALGAPRGFVPMLEGVVSVESRTIDRARGTAAALLAGLGVGLEPILRGLRWQLDQGHASRVAPGQLLAVGALGKALPDEARRGLGSLVRRVLEGRLEKGTVPVAAHAALTDLGEPADLLAMARACLAAPRYGWSDVVEQTAFVLDLVGRRADLPVELAEPYTRDDDSRLHLAAVRALRARGAPVPETRVADPCTLGHLTEAKLVAALGDERTVPRVAVAMRLAETPVPAASAALIAGFARLPAPRHEDDLRQKTRRHWLRALLATGAAEGHALLERALADEPELVPLEELPAPLAGTVVAIYLRAKDKRLREAARHWIGGRSQAPEVTRALEAVGLAPEDFPRRSR